VPTWFTIAPFPTAINSMSTLQEDSTQAFFEIDHPSEFGQFILSSRQEIIFYLRLLAKQRSLVTVYINNGQNFFLSSIIAIDEIKNQVILDPSSDPENNTLALAARQITLLAKLDHVEMQLRLNGVVTGMQQGQNVLVAAFPEAILRLQRREFFRLEPPMATPIHCKLSTKQEGGQSRNVELTLSDISGGGISLIGPLEMAADFSRDSLFQDCRLEIPGEGVIPVNLRVRKVIEISARSGEHSLRIGCEFVNLPSSRLAFIERYITRIERERKARHADALIH
jgi:c-di-GMP-binding flagellar brake protein YcgR